MQLTRCCTATGVSFFCQLRLSGLAIYCMDELDHHLLLPHTPRRRPRIRATSVASQPTFRSDGTLKAAQRPLSPIARPMSSIPTYDDTRPQPKIANRSAFLFSAKATPIRRSWPLCHCGIKHYSRAQTPGYARPLHRPSPRERYHRRRLSAAGFRACLGTTATRASVPSWKLGRNLRRHRRRSKGSAVGGYAGCTGTGSSIGSCRARCWRRSWCAGASG